VAILEYKDARGKAHRRAVGEYLGCATNNQAEIVAACIGLEALKRPCMVALRSDSQYVIQTMRGAFKRKRNHEWWERLDRAVARHEVTWSWTRGPAGEEWQERCDKAARAIAEAGEVTAAILERALAVGPVTDKP
jgi:ribonuclease HI